MLYRKLKTLSLLVTAVLFAIFSMPLQSVSALTVDKGLVEYGVTQYDENSSTCSTTAANDSLPTTATLPRSTIQTLDKAGVKDKAAANAARYQFAAEATGIPWQVIAALHYREGGMDPGKSISNGAPLGSGTNVDGVNVPSDPNQDAKQAAEIYVHNAKSVYGVDIAGTDATTEGFGKAFVAYNRGYMYKNWNMPWNKSPYAMNGFDDQHLNMKWTDADSYASPGGNKLNDLSGKTDTNVGALAVVAYLGGVELGAVSTCSNTAAADTGNILETAKGLAWHYEVANGKISKSDATPAYQVALPKYNGSTGENEYSDCGVFVSTVMHMSGADKDFPKRGTSVMLDYVQNSDKYEVISSPRLDDLKPGDILVKDGHIMFYAGNLSDGYTGMAASLNQHVPDYETSGDIAWMLSQPGVLAARLKQQP